MAFLRTAARGACRKSRFGVRRRKMQKWRKARGRHNKMRERRKGRANIVEIGYRTLAKDRGKIEGKIPKLITNLKQVEGIQKNEAAIIARMGKKKKQEIFKKLQEKGVKILN